MILKVKEIQKEYAMKKALNTILIVVAGLLAFVACSPQLSSSDELVSATLTSTDRIVRSLDSEVNFNLDDVKSWKYTARKANGGFTTGQTETGETNAVTLGEGGTTELLSQGAWNFVLYGYDVNNKLIAQGSINNATVTTANHVVTITVNPQQTSGAKGKIVISEDISIKSSDGTKTFTSGDDYDMSYVVYKTDADGKKTYLTDLGSVDVGTYYVEITFTGRVNSELYTAAQETRTVNVYAGLTTTVKGFINENKQAATLKREGSFVDIKSETVTTDTLAAALTLTANASPVGTEKTTAIEFPAKSLTLDDTNTSKALKLTVVATPIETATSIYTVENNGTAVAAFDIDLEGASTGTMTENNGIKITTYIEPGLGQQDNNLAVVFNGTEEAGQTSAKIISYESSSGKLEFMVYHFSEYYITTKECVVCDEASFLKAVQGKAGEIRFLNDITLTRGVIQLDRAVTIDLNTHTLNFNNANDSEIIFALPESENEYTVKFKNGFIKGTGGSSSGADLFLVNTNATLDIDDVDINASIHTCIYLKKGANPSNLTIKDSVFTLDGCYGVGTNAEDNAATTNIKIENTTINVTRTKSTALQDCTGLLVNVNAKVEITGSTITGQKQGMIIRGTGADAVAITNTTISSTGDRVDATYEGSGSDKKKTNDGYTDVPDETGAKWYSGNGVPLAALVIGNKYDTTGNATYPRVTTVTLDNVTLTTPNESTEREQLYVYQPSTTYAVTVNGSIVDYDSIRKNSNINGATITGLTAYIKTT